MLERTLSRLSSDGGSHNRAVVVARGGWFVVHGARNVDDVEVEAAASAYLETKLSLDQVSALRKARFASRPGRKTLMRRHPIEGLDRFLEGLVEAVFGAPIEDVQLHLGERDETSNPVLIEAMRVLARKRDTPSRQQLYRRLMDAELLLLVQGDAAARVGELQGWDVVAAFTDWDALALYDPRGRPFRRVTGRVLCPELYADQRVGSLLINPNGRVGGELYRNEIEAVARASSRP